MLVFFTIILIVLLGFCGLAIDVGRMELRTNQLQAAADAGALAGAGELMHGNGSSNFQTAANNDVAAYESANGIPATGSASPRVSANYGPYLNDYSTVQVTITQPLTTFFLGLLSQANASVTLSVKGVAEVPPCIYFMGNPTLTGTTYAYWIASAGMDTSNHFSCPVIPLPESRSTASRASAEARFAVRCHPLLHRSKAQFQ